MTAGGDLTLMTGLNQNKNFLGTNMAVGGLLVFISERRELLKAIFTEISRNRDHMSSYNVKICIRIFI